MILTLAGTAKPPESVDGLEADSGWTRRQLTLVRGMTGVGLFITGAAAARAEAGASPVAGVVAVSGLLLLTPWGGSVVPWGVAGFLGVLGWMSPESRSVGAGALALALVVHGLSGGRGAWRPPPRAAVWSTVLVVYGIRFGAMWGPGGLIPHLWSGDGGPLHGTQLGEAFVLAGILVATVAAVRGRLGVAFGVLILLELALWISAGVRGDWPLGGIGVWALLLVAVDPGWIPRKTSLHGGHVFYDGACGLCHRAVRWGLEEDRAGAFRFAPLAGTTFQTRLPASVRERLPDSMVLLRPDGTAAVRSVAVVEMAAGLGGWWRVLAVGASVFPRPLADLVYRMVARVRRRLFASPTDVCPVMDPVSRRRFDL